MKIALVFFFRPANDLCFCSLLLEFQSLSSSLENSLLSKILFAIIISLIRACVSNEILERGSSVRGGVLLRILGGGVPSGSLNPDPISDKNMPFSIRLYAPVVPLKTTPDFGSLCQPLLFFFIVFSFCVVKYYIWLIKIAFASVALPGSLFYEKVQLYTRAVIRSY